MSLATAVSVMPARAERFRARFASSARAHYTGQALRLLAGLAMILFAPEMRFSRLFTVFGWLLTLTAAGLLFVPWYWRRRFREWAIPLAIRYKKPTRSVRSH